MSYFCARELIFLVFCLVAPLPILSRCLLPLIALMVPQLGVFIVRVWLPAWRESDPSSFAMLAGALLIVSAGVHDIFLALSHDTGAFLPWAFLVFVFLHAAMLAGHFNRNQHRLEILIADLSKLLFDSLSGVVLFRQQSRDHRQGLRNRRSPFRR